MSPESSKPEKPVEAWRKWSPERKKKFKRTMREKMKAKRATRREEKQIRHGVPLYLYNLAKKVKNGAIARMAETNEAGDFELHALMLARKVMDGEDS